MKNKDLTTPISFYIIPLSPSSLVSLSLCVPSLASDKYFPALNFGWQNWGEGMSKNLNYCSFMYTILSPFFSTSTTSSPSHFPDSPSLFPPSASPGVTRVCSQRKSTKLVLRRHTGRGPGLPQCLRAVQLWGPTNFAPITNHMARFTKQAAAS